MLRLDRFSDAGYRFRFNYFSRDDSYMVPSDDKDEFYDLKFFNSDTYSGMKASSPEVIA